MAMRVLADEQWRELEPLLNEVRPRAARPILEFRRTIGAIVWRQQNGAKWRAIPAELGPWWRAAQTFIRWARLEAWERRHRLVRERRGSRFTRTARSADAADLQALVGAYGERDARDREKLERMEEYARTAYCRWIALHEWFGEEMAAERCGECDNCRKGIAALAGKPVEDPPLCSD